MAVHPLDPMIVDTHCHVHFPELQERIPALVDNMLAHDIGIAITVCTELNEAPLLRRIVAEHKQLYATIGVHPNSPADSPCDPDEITKLLDSDSKFVAVGECGLDYFRGGPEAKASQMPRLMTQVEVALQSGLPLVVHTRDSIDDTIDALEPAMRRGMKAVLHCFSGTWQQACRALDLGFMLSFTGIATFKSAKEILSIAQRIPAERLMFETDAPYLAPEPKRGKTNEPAYTKYILECVAAARNTEAAELAQITTSNAQRVFGLPAG